MRVLDANVVIGFLDAANAQHQRAVELLTADASERFVMHPATIAEVLTGPARRDRAGAARVWASILQMGVVEAQPAATPLDVATLRAKTGLPISDGLVILSAGEPSTGTAILTFDERLATEARALGYDVLP